MATRQQDVAAPKLPVSYEDVIAAHARVRDHIIHTPCLHSRTLSTLTGADIWLKFENLQFTAAYKERGALNKLLQMPESVRQRGVIAASAGNHSQGLSYHGKRLGVPTTIVMPRTTPMVKVQQTEGHGATVILHGETFDEAYAFAREVEKERHLTFVHPFDDPDIIAGQGTVALEMLADAPELETLIIPTGGGGLVAGCAVAARGINPNIEILGVQAELYPSMRGRLHGEVVKSDGDTLAEGIAVKQPGEVTFEIIRALVSDVLLVSESDMEHALALLLSIEKTVVEGGAAASLAAVMRNRARFAGKKLGLVLTGGNIDTRLLANVLLRDLARAGRLARLRIRLQDRPGQLYGVARIFNDQQVNILEVFHQRIFTDLPAKSMVTEIECETRDQAHLDRLITALIAAGYEVRPVELD